MELARLGLVGYYRFDNHMFKIRLLSRRINYYLIPGLSMTVTKLKMKSSAGQLCERMFVRYICTRHD